MNMPIEQIKPGRFALEDLKPSIEKNRILFPILATCEYVEEDGLSFGYPVDDGWVTIVKYDFAMGILVDDTISLAKNLERPSAPSCGISAIDSYDWSDEDADFWKIGLDSKWVEDEYNEWLEKGLIDSGESKDEWLTDSLENYHCWPTEWKQAYNKQSAELNAPVGSKEVVLVNDALTLYKDENKEYFFTTQYFNHGKITKADLGSAEEYIASFKTYEAEMVTYRNRQKQLSENLTLLRTFLISTTEPTRLN